jgi:hypothetical protein
MADTKISALPASTTPLAGTEVLPIVQSSATKQVSVANLTAGRAISATQLTLSAGNVIVANGYGVDFSATPGTGTSELFADYEEGTWTPNDASGVSLTFTSPVGYYTKIGRMVYAYFSLTYPTTATGNDASIGGLPFTTNGSATLNPGMLTVGFTTAGLFITGVSGGGVTNFVLLNQSGGANIVNSLMSTKSIRGVFVYFV